MNDARQPLPTVYADFQNQDPQSRLRLICAGTATDLKRLGLRLEAGLRLNFSDGELSVRGTVVWSDRERCWAAEFNPADVGYIETD